MAGTSARPVKSLVADTSFTLTPYQRTFRETLTVKTEQAVGEKLARATGRSPVPGSRGTRKIVIDDRARFLSEQIPPGQRAAPITEPMLIKEPYITDPRSKAPEDFLASSKPDFLYVTPK
jgi:hypothetical protein